MNVMEGKVAIVTGGGRGIGKEECLLLAKHGAKVVVNDLGGELDGSSKGQGPADEVVNLIRQSGGQAVANFENVTHFEGAKRIIDCAISEFGGLDALINNAGNVRDRMIYNMSEDDFDAVVAVHLKGHFNCTRWAAEYWRAESKKGSTVSRHIVNTTSASGLIGNVGQTNYGAAKAGIAAMTRIWGMELSRYNVRVNAIAPVARTRMTEATFGPLDGDQGEEFDMMDPANIAPLAVFLASDISDEVNGEVFALHGGNLDRYLPWHNPKSVSKEERYTVYDIKERLKELY